MWLEFEVRFLVGTQNFFFVPRSWQDGNIFLYLVTELKTYHLSYTVYKNDVIDIAHPNSMQEACHVNFVIYLPHRKASVVEHRSAESEGLRFDSS